MPGSPWMAGLASWVIAQTTGMAARRHGWLAPDVDRCVGPDRLPKRQSSLAGHKGWVAALAFGKWSWSWSRWRAWQMRSRTFGGRQPGEQPEKVGTLGGSEQGCAEPCMGLGGWPSSHWTERLAPWSACLPSARWSLDLG